MSKYKQYLLRLNPQAPHDAALIERMEAARQEWGGVQRVLKDALQHYHTGQQPEVREAHDNSPALPAALLEDLTRAVPNLTSTAAQAMAASPPLKTMRSLYAALEAFTPDTLTEIDALLLRAVTGRIADVLEKAAAGRQPIRFALQSHLEKE